MLSNQKNKVQNGTSDVCPYKSDEILPTTLSSEMFSKISGNIFNGDKDFVEFIKNNDPPAKVVPYSGKFIPSKKNKLYVKKNLNARLFVYKRNFGDLEKQTHEIMRVLYNDKCEIEDQYKHNLYSSKKFAGFLDRCLFKMFKLKLDKCVICMKGSIANNQDINNVIKYINNHNFSRHNAYSSVCSYEETCNMIDEGQQNWNNLGLLCKYKCKIKNVVVMRDTKTDAFVRILRNCADTIGKAIDKAKVKISHDGTKIVAALSNNTAIVWNVETDEVEHILEGHTDTINKANFSPNGKIIVTISNDGTARVWDAKNGKSKHILICDKAIVSPDGKIIVTISNDFTVKVWNIETGCLLHTLPAMTVYSNSQSLNFSPDGTKIVATLNNYNYIKLTTVIWDVETGNIVNTLPNHKDLLWGSKFSSDGTKIILGRYGNAMVWDYMWKEDNIKWLLGGNLRLDRAEIIRRMFVEANQVGTPLIIDKNSKEEILLSRLPRDKQRFLKKYLDIKIKRQPQSYMKFIWRRFCRIFQTSSRCFSNLYYEKRDECIGVLCGCIVVLLTLPTIVRWRNKLYNLQ